jgi:hypothetical protein
MVAGRRLLLTSLQRPFRTLQCTISDSGRRYVWYAGIRLSHWLPILDPRSGRNWRQPGRWQLIVEGRETKAYLAVIWYEFALLVVSGISVVLLRAPDARDKGIFKAKA